MPAEHRTTEPDAVDAVSAACGFAASESLSAMRRDLYAFLGARGWTMTGSGVGESRFTNGRMVDVSAKIGTRHLVIEIHEFEVNG